MKLIGVETGNYEGNNWARLHVTEDFNKSSGVVGQRVLALKCDYSLAVGLLQKKDWIGKEVEAWYDRFGRVQDLGLSA